MSKAKRYKSTTKIYHIMSRALNKQMLFDDERDFFFLSILSQAKKEYLKQAESTIMVNVIKLINMGIPLMQLSRVTGFCYSKIQRLRIGKEGKVISLTYKERK